MDSDVVAILITEVPRLPVIMQFFEVLQAFGYPCDVLPLSIGGAVKNLTQTIENGEGHVHLHIHKHTHSEVDSALGKYQRIRSKNDGKIHQWF